MKKPRISVIVAIGAKTRVMGRDNDLIWKLPGDLPRFKSLTTGHPIIMGRKTFESIGRPLPNRTNIIITRQHDYKPEGTLVVHSLDEAIAEATLVEEDEIFIIGGGEICKQAMPITERLYLTLVDDDAKGDVYFPDYSEFRKIVSKEEHLDNTPPFTYIILEK